MNDEYELVKFEQNGLTLDVNVSPQEETVWLSKEQIAFLFDRDRSVISRHINNIYKEGELPKESSCAKNAHEVNGQIHYTEFFNLDVIISVGYRVKSQNGVVFRKWANNVLKQYLLKGYVVNENRTLVTNENYINLINKVENIDLRLSRLERNDNAQNEVIFFDGEYFDARSFLKQIFSEAKNKITLIDPYADIKTLDYLKAKDNGVEISLFTSSKAKLTKGDIRSFNLQYGGLQIHVINTFHDRFIIIDDTELYHLGTSLNYLAKKTFAITKMDPIFISSIIDRTDIKNH